MPQTSQAPLVAVPRPSLRRMWRLWSVYGVSSILGRSLAFLLLPLYTRVLTPQEYGIRAMVALGLEAVLLLVAFGLKEAINRFASSGEGNGAPDPSAASTGIIAHNLLIGVGVVAGLALSPWLSGVLLGDRELAWFLRLGFIGAFFLHAQEAAFVYLRARGQAGTVALVSLSTLPLLVALNLVFVVALRWGVAGIFYAEILVYGVSGTSLTIYALRKAGVAFSLALVRRMIAFGAPLMFIPFSWIFVSRIDAMFLTHHGSLAVVGIYALAVQCAQVIQMALIYPFHNFWDPAQFQIARDPDGPRVYRRMFQWFTFTTVVAAFCVALFAEDVIAVMTSPAFHEAATVVPLLVVTYVLLGVQMFFNAALLVRGRTGLVAAVAVLTAGVNVACNAVLVPWLLAAGAATARIVALTVMAGVTFAIAQRLWRQQPNFAALAKVSGWAVALFVLSRWLPETSLLVTLLVKGFLVVALVALSLWSGAVERRDVAAGWTLVRDRLRRPRVIANVHYREGETT